jgi:hypothetical protein
MGGLAVSARLAAQEHDITISSSRCAPAAGTRSDAGCGVRCEEPSDNGRPASGPGLAHSQLAELTFPKPEGHLSPEPHLTWSN